MADVVNPNPSGWVAQESPIFVNLSQVSTAHRRPDGTLTVTTLDGEIAHLDYIAPDDWLSLRDALLVYWSGR